MIARLFSVIVVIMMVVSVIGCSEDGADQSSSLQGSTATSQTGVIQVRMHDAPPEYDITEVWVTIKQIEIHIADAKGNTSSEPTPGEQPTNSGSGMARYSPWITLTMVGTAPIELMQYQDGLEALLADHELDPGKYTQIRLAITDVEVVYTEGSGTQIQRATAKLPSDKLKFTKPFDIIEGETTILSFDFSVEDSIVITGAGEVIVKPVLTLEISYQDGIVPTPDETQTPDDETTIEPSPDATPTPKKEKTGKPTPDESPTPKKEQTGKPTPDESPTPEDEPTGEPTSNDIPTPDDEPTDKPTPNESPTPDDEPTDEPTPDESPTPEDEPTSEPTPDESPTPDNKPDFVPTPGKGDKTG